jgi:dihydrofolate reductase
MTWNSKLLSRDDALGDIAHLREQPGGDLVTWGSVSLVQGMLAAGLVDQLNLLIEPIVLGGGKRIFVEDGAARPWQLVSSITAGTGVLLCTYRPA